MENLLKSDLRSYGDYWDLKINYPIDKGVVGQFIGQNDVVVVVGDDGKYDLPMMKAAIKVGVIDEMKTMLNFLSETLGQ